MAPLLMLLEVFMDLMLPTLMARIVDEGIISSNMKIIMETGLLMLGVMTIGFIGGIGCTIFSTYASTGVARDLRFSLYEKVLSFSHTNIDKMETGSIITRLTNDVQQVERLVKMGLRILVRAPLQVLGSLIMALIISPSLSSVFLILIPIILAALVIIIRISYPLYSQVQDKMDKVNNRLQENLAGIRLVKAFVRQDFEQEKFSGAIDELMYVNIKAARIVAFSLPLMMFLLNMGVLAVLWIGGNLVWAENLMIGKVIAFINYMMQLLMSLIMVSHLLMNISRSQASIKRIDELFQEKTTLFQIESPIENNISGRIEFKNVTFSYDNQKGTPILKDISFIIKSGEKIAFLGATGSGKSTVASLIPRLYDVTSGEILIDDINIKNYSLKNIRASIGMSPQQTILFSGSIKDNILYGNTNSETERNYANYASTASISHFISTLPEGFETDIKQRGVNLSGGQKQRISIARALGRDSSIIILDDSTSSVDTRTERSILQSINEIGNRTLIIIAQRISTAIYADRIILFENGEIAGIGTHDQLLRDNDIYKDIFLTQNGDKGVSS